MTAVASPTGEIERLLASAVAGDERAFASIVGAHHEDMRRVCVVVVGNQAIADEAVDAAWSKAWLKLGSVRDPARLRAWLVSIAVNEARQIVRSRSRRALVEITVDQLHDVAAEDSATSAILAIDLRNAVARLRPEDRALLAMRYVAGFDATELAYATGLTPSGTRARLARLLHRLEKELGDE